MLRRVSTLTKNRRHISYQSNQSSSKSILFYQSIYHESNTNDVKMDHLFGASPNAQHTLNEVVTDHVLTRSEFGFYQRLLPIDTVQDMMSSINSLLGNYYIFEIV